MSPKARAGKERLESLLKLALEVSSKLLVFPYEVGVEFVLVVTDQTAPPLVLYHAKVQRDEVVRGQSLLESLVVGHSNPSPVDLFRAELEVFLAERIRLGVWVVVKHSRNDVALNGTLQVVNFENQVMVKGEGESSEHERKIDPIFMANQTAGRQVNLEQ
jgi:hypothetical protein